MALTLNGPQVLQAILSDRGRFKAVKPADFSRAGLTLLKKQLVAGRQTLDDYRALQAVVGEDNFDLALDTLTAGQSKAVAKRIDPFGAQHLATGRDALQHIRAVLAGTQPPAQKQANVKAASPPKAPEPPEKPKGLKRRSSSVAKRRS